MGVPNPDAHILKSQGTHRYPESGALQQKDHIGPITDTTD